MDQPVRSSRVIHSAVVKEIQQCFATVLWMTGEERTISRVVTLKMASNGGPEASVNTDNRPRYNRPENNVFNKLFPQHLTEQKYFIRKDKILVIL